MQTTNGKYYSYKAVDGNRNGQLAKGSCASTKKFKEPWWRVDLGNKVWVEKVLIANRDDCCHKELSNVEIRVGNRKETGRPSNPICRQGLEVPKEPWLYSCAEPMLGKYVYIRLLDKFPRELTICEVEVYVDKTARLSYSKFLVPVMNGKLEKPTFLRYEKDKVVMKLGQGSTMKVRKKDIIVDLPPKEESLWHGVSVYLPVKYDSYLRNATATCGRGGNSEFLNGIFVSEIYAKMKYAVNVTNNVRGRRKFKNKLFNCSELTDLRMKGDICKLQVNCQSHSSCESKHVSSSFPPGSYQCVCDDGYSSSGKRPGNVVAPGEHCIAIPLPEPKLKYSKQNLALNSKTSSSPVDNYAGCKQKNCKEIPALAKLAVDGDYKKCYRSVSTHKPWLQIHLDGTHPIVLIQIATSKEFDLKRVKILIGHSGKKLGAESVFAVKDIPKDTLWNIGSDTVKTTFFGDVVKIQTSSYILALCEVEVYAEPYANVALKHAALGSTNSSDKGNPLAAAATDGKYLLSTPPCFYSKYKNKASWVTDLGPNNRVAMVFIYLQKELADVHSWNGMKDIDIYVGNHAPGFTEPRGVRTPNDSLCCHVTKPIMLGKYLECKQTLVGRFLKIQASKPDIALELCEVEVFPTRIVNLAGSRSGYSSSQQVFAGLATDHKMDEAFTTDMDREKPWWSVDLLIKTKIHMVRIVTAIGYKKSDFEGLQLKIGDGHPGDYPSFMLTAPWKPTEGTVQVMTCPKNTRGRYVTLELKRKIRSILSFREVEVYNGPLLDVDECEVPGICPKSLKCVNLPISYTCECRDGYKARAGNSTDCLDIDECVLDAKSACPLKNTYCLNTAGSHKCLCRPGYAPVYDDHSKLSSCQDIDECSNSSLYSCPTNNSKCMNEPGSYRCGCAAGYGKLWSSEYRDQDIKCIDADECNDGSSLCHMNATCANTIGSYTCTCNYGTRGNGRVCKSMDSCSDSKPCIANFICRPIKRIHFCVCEEGYEDAGKKCADKDECATQDHNCGSNSLCSNTEGSYACSCNPGFKSTSHDGRNCKDIDECKREIEHQRQAVGDGKKDFEKLCGEAAKCKNEEGGYFCECPKGFAFDEKTKACMDFDECAGPKSPCRPNEVCTNTVASYACSCQSGYRLNYERACEDVDECLENHECDEASNCNNTIGGYVCICKAGYWKTEDGRCEEECATECDENAYCSHGMCYCLPGYEHDPINDFCYDPEALYGSSVSPRFSALVFAASLVCYLTFAYL